jgi:hypothetical protein
VTLLEVVVAVRGQVANAFACRSTVRPVWRVGWTTNRLLLGALVAQLGMLAAVLYFRPLADLLGRAGATAAGFAVALLAVPSVVAADAAQKAVVRARRRRTRISPAVGSFGP